MSKRIEDVLTHCMLCKQLFTEHSEEHVILNALGGTLSRSRMICAPCNNKTGTELDAPFLAGFEWITTIVNPKNRRRDVPRLKKLQTADGDILSIQPGGTIQVETRRLSDGRWIADGSKAQHIAEWVNAAAQALAERTGQPVTVGTEIGQKFNPAFNFSLSFDAHIIFRSATKASLEALSVATANGRFMSDSSLDPFRSYVLNGAGSFSPDVGFLAEPLYPELLEALEHSILLLDRDDGSVYFEVTTYGGLTCVAGVLPTVAKQSLPWLYRVDPVSGNRSISHPRISPPREANWILPPATPNESRFKAAVERVGRLWQQRGDQAHIDRIFNESWLEVMTEPGKPITETHTRVLTEKIVTRFVDYLRNTKRIK